MVLLPADNARAAIIITGKVTWCLLEGPAVFVTRLCTCRLPATGVSFRAGSMQAALHASIECLFLLRLTALHILSLPAFLITSAASCCPAG